MQNLILIHLALSRGYYLFLDNNQISCKNQNICSVYSINKYTVFFRTYLLKAAFFRGSLMAFSNLTMAWQRNSFIFSQSSRLVISTPYKRCVILHDFLSSRRSQDEWGRSLNVNLFGSADWMGNENYQRDYWKSWQTRWYVPILLPLTRYVPIRPRSDWVEFNNEAKK